MLVACLLLRVGGLPDPPGVSVCRNVGPAGPSLTGGAPAPGRSCALKPELKSCVVIPAGETVLARSGALSQRAAGVTGGPSTFITPQCFCAAPTRTALFIEPQSSVLLKLDPRNKYRRSEVLMRPCNQLRLTRAGDLQKMLVLPKRFSRRMFRMTCAVSNSALSVKIQ